MHCRHPQAQERLGDSAIARCSRLLWELPFLQASLVVQGTHSSMEICEIIVQNSRVSRLSAGLELLHSYGACYILSFSRVRKSGSSRNFVENLVNHLDARGRPVNVSFL